MASQIVENVPRTVLSHILEPGSINTELREADPGQMQYVSSTHVFCLQNYYTSSPCSRSFLKVYALIVSCLNTHANHDIGSHL